MLKGIRLEDRISVPTARHITDAGQMIVPCAFARTGLQAYTAGSLGLTDRGPNEIVHVMRHESDVFDAKTMASFRSAPVTIGHPVSTKTGRGIKVTAANAGRLQVGMLEGMPTRDEDTVTGTLVITRKDAIDHIEEGTKELSAGYTCDLEMVDEKDGTQVLYQRNIRANHIAIVSRGRAGAACSIADEALVEKAKAEEVVAMEVELDKEAVVVDAVLEAVVEDVAEAVVEDVAEAVVEDEAPEAVVEDADLEVVEDVVLEDDVKIVVVKIEDELEAAKTSLVALTDELSEAVAMVASLRYELDSSVEERVNTILVAKDLTDLEDFSGKSVSEIKKLVVANLMPNLNLDGKDEAYMCARFDVLTEDAEIGETPMGRLLRDNVDASHIVVKPSTLVADARARSTERHKARSN